MVKLFVGNLADGVDSDQLRKLFSEHVPVQECDVLKNFAFVHVLSDGDADVAIARLNKRVLAGREVHVERSTSRLRKDPGMGSVCFTCGAGDHKTPLCPRGTSCDAAGSNAATDIAASASGSTGSASTVKRPAGGDTDAATPKKARFLSSYLSGGSAEAKSNAGSSHETTATAEDADAELPCPQNPELRTLYKEYVESRTRYFFFRDRLRREIEALQRVGAFVADNRPVHVGTIDLTGRSGTGPSILSSVASSSSTPSMPTITIVQPHQTPQSQPVRPLEPYSTPPAHLHLSHHTPVAPQQFAGGTGRDTLLIPPVSVSGPPPAVYGGQPNSAQGIYPSQAAGLGPPINLQTAQASNIGGLAPVSQQPPQQSAYLPPPSSSSAPITRVNLSAVLSSHIQQQQIPQSIQSSVVSSHPSVDPANGGGGLQPAFRIRIEPPNNNSSSSNSSSSSIARNGMRPAQRNPMPPGLIGRQDGIPSRTSNFPGAGITESPSSVLLGHHPANDGHVQQQLSSSTSSLATAPNRGPSAPPSTNLGTPSTQTLLAGLAAAMVGFQQQQQQKGAVHASGVPTRPLFQQPRGGGRMGGAPSPRFPPPSVNDQFRP